MFDPQKVNDLTLDEFLSLTPEEQGDARFLMSKMKASLLQIQLTTKMSRERSEVARKRIREAQLKENVLSSYTPPPPKEEINVEYVLKGRTPYEISRRVRELCSKKAAEFASVDKISNAAQVLDLLAKYDRDATLISNMSSVSEVIRYLTIVGYHRNQKG